MRLLLRGHYMESGVRTAVRTPLAQFAFWVSGPSRPLSLYFLKGAVCAAHDLAVLDDHADILYRFSVEEGFEAAADAVDVRLLCVQRRAGGVRCHSVVGHR